MHFVHRNMHMTQSTRLAHNFQWNFLPIGSAP